YCWGSQTGAAGAVATGVGTGAVSECICEASLLMGRLEAEAVRPPPFPSWPNIYLDVKIHEIEISRTQDPRIEETSCRQTPYTDRHGGRGRPTGRGMAARTP